MKKYTALLWALIQTNVLLAGGLKGNLISDEVLFVIVFILIAIPVLSVIFSIHYYRKKKTWSLVLGALLSIPSLCAGLFFILGVREMYSLLLGLAVIAPGLLNLYLLFFPSTKNKPNEVQSP